MSEVIGLGDIAITVTREVIIFPSTRPMAV
jgi:hypothetical protein